MPARARLAGLAAFYDQEPAVEDFRSAVLRGLSRAPKAIPAKYFYDLDGSRLFEEICALEEYYPTRTEVAILQEHAAAIGARLPEGAIIVELGSGSTRKIEVLLDAVRLPRAYVPVDISRDHLLAQSRRLAARRPDLAVIPVCADFVDAFELPEDLPAGPRVAFFPGSTIGNFYPAEAVALLAGVRRGVGAGGSLLIGVDLKKDPRVLRRAYNDAAGVTAAFNLNLLRRINRELAGSFDPATFVHRADYDARAGRIEMHLVSDRAQRVEVAGRTFRFQSGESIHTENSYKYAIDEFTALAGRAGFVAAAGWTDPDALFAVLSFAVAGTP
jgi:dimethylhistidine N-methyltransferase